MSLNLSADPTDHSLLEVDSKDLSERETINTMTLDTFSDIEFINEIDFLKIDAEGFEPEVLSSVEKTPVHKIAVDCSPERKGESTITQVSELLDEKGFDCREENTMLFAKKSADS